MRSNRLGLAMILVSGFAAAQSKADGPPPSVRAVAEGVVFSQPDRAEIDIGVVAEALRKPPPKPAPTPPRWLPLWGSNWSACSWWSNPSGKCSLPRRGDIDHIGGIGTTSGSPTGQTHLYYSAWYPHARYHGLSMLLIVICVSAVAIWLLWRRSLEPELGVKVADRR
jgi:hypothetical protein